MTSLPRPSHSEPTTSLRKFTRNLSPSHFTSATTPTLRDLRTLIPFLPHHLPSTILSPLKDPENLPPHSTPTSISQWSKQFDKSSAPAARATSTRKSYSRAWASFLTFCALHADLHSAIPASLSTLKAYCQFLLHHKYSPGTIKGHLSAILHRHSLEHLPLPASRLQIRELYQTLAHIPRQPSRIISPITPDILHRISLLKPSSWKLSRNKTMIIIGTLCALRASELINLRICHIHFAHDPAYPSGVAIFIGKRKNDQSGRGLWPRIAPGSNLRTCPVSCLRHHISLSKIQPSPFCLSPSHTCLSCPLLFPSQLHHPLPMRVQDVTWALRHSLSNAGIPRTQTFSSSSLRRGGLTTASEAGIPEDIRTLQSGHTSHSNRNYETPVHQLYKFSQAFGL